MRIKIFIPRGHPRDHRPHAKEDKKKADDKVGPPAAAEPVTVGFVESILSLIELIPSLIESLGKPDSKRGLIKIITIISIIILIVGVAFLLLRSFLKPSEPEFVLQDITIYSFDVSTPNSITSNFGVTISSRNPNSNIGFYYNKLDVYTSYRDQQITSSTAILPNYQDRKETKVWSPTVYGTDVPLAPYNAISIYQDQATGSVMLAFKIVGQASWKFWSLTLGKHNVNVKCLAFVPFGSQQTGVVVDNNAVKYQLVHTCSI